MLSALIFFTTFAFCQELPPKVLYHIGQKAILLENARQGTIPQDAWDKNIMGTDTRYGLVPFRRGLYGGSNFDNLELYGNLYFGSPKIPWVMAITLKDECRTEEASTEYFDDPRYLGWVLNNFTEIARTAQECIIQGGEFPKDCRWVLVGFSPVANGKTENRCDVLQEKFLTDIHAKVVKDEGWASSWYIRDRSCIEKIEASPAAVLDILAQANWDRKSRTSTYSGTAAAYGGTSAYLLWSALIDDPNPSKATLQKIEEKAGKSDITADFMEDTPAGKDFWIKAEIPKLIEALKDCDKNGKLGEFQSLGKEYADLLSKKENSIPKTFST